MCLLQNPAVRLLVLSPARCCHSLQISMHLNISVPGPRLVSRQPLNACPAIHCSQDELLLVAMQLMMGGSLRAMLVNPLSQDMLRWNNW